jgi:hypothetical protein
VLALDRHNFLVGCAAAVLALAILVLGIGWASVAVTVSNDHRKAAHYRACQTLPVPERTVCLNG